MNKRAYIFSAIVTALMLGACEKKLELVDVDIEDPIRHYYPIIQGELLGVTYEIENLSDHPLFIQEIQTTCGCFFVSDQLPIVIPANQKKKIHLNYNSLKNVGYVDHYAWLYGNFTDSLWREVRFDTNVVPPRDYTRDYEQLWHDYEAKTPEMKDLVDGNSTDKGYYTHEYVDPRFENLEETESFIDKIIGF